MSDTEPQMRAAHIQENLRSLLALGSDVDARVRAAVGVEVVAAIEDSHRVAWLPVGLDVALTGALGRITSRSAVRKWSRDAMIASAATPLLRSFFATALRTLGSTPRATLRWAPRGWDAIYRNCGALRFEGGDEALADIIYTQVPSVMDDDLYLEGIAGAFEGAAALVGAEASISVLRAEGEIRFRVQW